MNSFIQWGKMCGERNTNIRDIIFIMKDSWGIRKVGTTLASLQLKTHSELASINENKQIRLLLQWPRAELEKQNTGSRDKRNEK